MDRTKLAIPYCFCGSKITNFEDLNNQFLRHWDYGAAALKRGALTEYFAKLYEADPQERWKEMHAYAKHFEAEMWDEELHEDIVFARFMHYLEREKHYLPNVPMDDMDIIGYGPSYKRCPEEKYANQYPKHYGSTSEYDNKFIEAYYLHYMSVEANKQGLWETYEGKRREVDAADPDEEKESE